MSPFSCLYRSPVLLPTLLLLFLSGCNRQQNQEVKLNSPEDIAAVEETVERWFNDAIATLDTTVIGSYLTPTFGSTEPIGWVDKKAFLEWITTFEEDFGGPFTLEYSLYDWHTTVRGDVAWTNMWNDGILRVEGKEPQYMKWAESGVLIRQADGRWLIDRYHSIF